MRVPVAMKQAANCYNPFGSLYFVDICSHLVAVRRSRPLQ